MHKYHMVKFLIALFLLFPPLSEAATKSVILPSGETIEVQSISKIYAAGSKEWVLIINYITDSIDNKVSLRERADLIWEFFRPIVEKAGYTNAGIKAKAYVHDAEKTIFKKSKAYTFIIRKSDDGIWRFLEDEKQS
ncbi:MULTISPECIES: hypothetical protein [Vibrio]|uniref:DUF4783 domain-containing protein n=1 Tax=Vibrio bivalvicida TaxID=1276888 RepID=A0ABV4MQ56_9VIBR|nr:hypothetical protein [Vibrio sp. VPAP30]